MNSEQEDINSVTPREDDAKSIESKASSHASNHQQEANKEEEEEEDDHEGEISDSFSSLDDDELAGRGFVSDGEYYEEEEIIEEEEIDEEGKPHYTYKISKGLTKVFKRSKIGDAKTRKVTDYSNVKWEHNGPRELRKEEEPHRQRVENNAPQERERRTDLKISEGLQFKRGPVKKIKISPLDSFE